MCVCVCMCVCMGRWVCACVGVSRKNVREGGTEDMDIKLYLNVYHIYISHMCIIYYIYIMVWAVHRCIIVAFFGNPTD